jgi:hypothetical protein
MPDGPGGWGLPSRNTITTGGGFGSGLGGVLRAFHVPWPACNQDGARQAAEAWNALADGIDDVTTDCTNMVNSIAANNSGKAIDAFAADWQKYGGKSGALTVSSEACRALAKACDGLADQVSEVKTEIERKAEELVAAVAAAVVVLVFTWGFSIAVAEGMGDAVAATVTEMMATLADAAAPDIHRTRGRRRLRRGRRGVCRRLCHRGGGGKRGARYFRGNAGSIVQCDTQPVER